MYFTNCNTVGEIKSAYRKLAFQFHPDLNGPECTATMQEINAQYHDLLESLDGETTRGTDNKDHTYHYNRDVEQAVMDKIAELLALNLDGVEIELVGTWVWAHGNTRPHSKKLGKAGAGMTFHGKRKRWYWHNGPRWRRRSTNKGFDDLRAMYGSQTFENESETGVAAA